jgi:hypothetical protein
MSLVIVLFSVLLSFASGSHVLTPHDTVGGGPMVAPGPGLGSVGSRPVVPSDTTGGGPMFVPPLH